MKIIPVIYNVFFQSEHSSAKNLSVHLASLEKSRDMFEGRPGSLNHTAHFQTSFIGMIQDASDNGSGTRDMDLQVVDRVEEAQVSKWLRY